MPLLSQDNELYLPVYETLAAFGVDEKTITEQDGYLQFFVYANEPGSIVDEHGQTFDYWINRMRLGSRYIYIAGQSSGSTENDKMKNVPIMQDGTLYAPYEFFEKLQNTNQGQFCALNGYLAKAREVEPHTV